jgi:hypothetical protein
MRVSVARPPLHPPVQPVASPSDPKQHWLANHVLLLPLLLLLFMYFVVDYDFVGTLHLVCQYGFVWRTRSCLCSHSTVYKSSIYLSHSLSLSLSHSLLALLPLLLLLLLVLLGYRNIQHQQLSKVVLVGREAAKVKDAIVDHGVTHSGTSSWPFTGGIGAVAPFVAFEVEGNHIVQAACAIESAKHDQKLAVGAQRCAASRRRNITRHADRLPSIGLYTQTTQQPPSMVGCCQSSVMRNETYAYRIDACLPVLGRQQRWS